MRYNVINQYCAQVDFDELIKIRIFQTFSYVFASIRFLIKKNVIALLNVLYKITCQVSTKVLRDTGTTNGTTRYYKVLGGTTSGTTIHYEVLRLVLPGTARYCELYYETLYEVLREVYGTTSGGTTSHCEVLREV